MHNITPVSLLLAHNCDTTEIHMCYCYIMKKHLELHINWFLTFYSISLMFFSTMGHVYVCEVAILKLVSFKTPYTLIFFT